MNLLLVLASLTPSRAAEVQFEGFYRARFRAFDTLSLSRGEVESEGLAAYAQHRLWLKPKFLLSDQVSLFVEIRGLDGVVWGDQPGVYDPYAQLGDVPPNLFEYDLTAPTSTTDAGFQLLDLSLWRAWGQVYTPIGEFTFGRVPLHWGTGIWLNDGISVDPDFADHGDTTDRVMWEKLIQDQFFLRAHIDVPTERLIGTNDDSTNFGLGVSYKVEDLTAGVLLQLDHTGPRGDAVDSLNLFTVDASGDVTLGKLGVAGEFVGQFGGGDFDEGVNDANITAFGASLRANLDLDAWNIGLRGGLATGDANPGDSSFTTFTFDRDYSVGMFLFEQPMPILSTGVAGANDTNQGRDYESVLTGTAVSNALFVKPTISRRLVDGLTADVSWLGARVMKIPQISGLDQRRGYGNEVQLGLRYDGIEHFTVDGRVGAFLPGSVYSVEAEGQGATPYTEPAFGAQVMGRIDF